MKKIISIVLCLVLAFSLVSCANKTSSPTKVSTDEFEKSGLELCSDMVAGWNLGNTLDSCQIWGDLSDNPTPSEQETAWNNPVTTQKMINKVVSSGFNVIRVPVTWGLQIVEENGKYTIKEDWLNRVKEVADYCINEGAYTIVNMHHDDASWLNISADDDEWKEIKEKYRQIWEQIAVAFKDYGEKLILEGANEITATTSFDGCGETEDKCWWGHNEEAFARQNELYKIFIETVRKSGGYNDKRYLALPTYGAQWYDNQINNLYVPENDDHIIMDVHWYQPDTSNKDANRWVFSTMRNFAKEHNIGAILGESGMMADADELKKVYYGENVVGCAKEYDIPVLLWDDGGSVKILMRDLLKWNSDAYIDSVIKAAKNTEVLY